jgi:nitrate/nitrite-specific signal transduction histidine kinase
VRAQEFILTLCIVGIGFAVLLSELQTRERELESRVRERTRELELANRRLAAMGAGQARAKRDKPADAGTEA